METDFLTRVRALLWSVSALFLAVGCTGLFVLSMVGFPLVVIWIGIPWLLGALAASRPLANWHRRRASRILGREIGDPYLRRNQGNPLLRLRARLYDPATWRDLMWLGINGTAGIVISAVAIVESVLDLLFWWIPPGMMLRLHAYLAAALLSPNRHTTLAQRVQELGDSRAATLDSAAAELRRIERDLHDGAQARLVLAGMNLGMAEHAIDTDPDRARELVAEAREATSAALSDLRDLVHGIHPPLLADRGLEGAVQELCLGASLPIEVRFDAVPQLPPPVESAAYFGILEAVTNLVKHGGARHGRVHAEVGSEGLRVTVSDDGAGGACIIPGGGLDGIRRRLSAFDGTVTVDSPTGGPTAVVLFLPVPTEQ